MRVEPLWRTTRQEEGVSLQPLARREKELGNKVATYNLSDLKEPSRAVTLVLETC